MKTLAEKEFYSYLRLEMMAYGEKHNVAYARFFAYELDFGGAEPEKYLRSIFTDDTKSFTKEQLAKILNILNEYRNIKSFAQDEMKQGVLNVVAQAGDLISAMQKYFDNDNEISRYEASKLTPYTLKLASLAKTLHLRLEETKAQEGY